MRTCLRRSAKFIFSPPLYEKIIKQDKIYVKTNFKIKRLDKLDSFNVKYNELKVEMDSLESQLVSNNRQINDNITRVKSFLESNPKCPTCNTTITKNKIDKIIKELEG